MLKTKRKTDQPKWTFEDGRKFLVDLDRNPEIGFDEKTVSEFNKRRKKKGGNK